METSKATRLGECIIKKKGIKFDLSKSHDDEPLEITHDHDLIKYHYLSLFSYLSGYVLEVEGFLDIVGGGKVFGREDFILIDGFLGSSLKLVGIEVTLESIFDKSEKSDQLERPNKIKKIVRKCCSHNLVLPRAKLESLKTTVEALYALGRNQDIS